MLSTTQSHMMNRTCSELYTRRLTLAITVATLALIAVYSISLANSAPSPQPSHQIPTDVTVLNPASHISDSE